MICFVQLVCKADHSLPYEEQRDKKNGKICFKCVKFDFVLGWINLQWASLKRLVGVCHGAVINTIIYIIILYNEMVSSLKTNWNCLLLDI